jgi:hypothetical protein
MYHVFPTHFELNTFDKTFIEKITSWKYFAYKPSWLSEWLLESNLGNGIYRAIILSYIISKARILF